MQFLSQILGNFTIAGRSTAATPAMAQTRGPELGLSAWPLRGARIDPAPAGNQTTVSEPTNLPERQ